MQCEPKYLIMQHSSYREHSSAYLIFLQCQVGLYSCLVSVQLHPFGAQCFCLQQPMTQTRQQACNPNTTLVGSTPELYNTLPTCKTTYCCLLQAQGMVDDHGLLQRQIFNSMHIVWLDVAAERAASTRAKAQHSMLCYCTLPHIILESPRLVRNPV